MVRFLDGPAAGSVLTLARAPIYLRVVIDETDGRVDALDLLDDTPGPSERVHVYQRVAYAGAAYVCSRGRGGGCREIVLAEYEHVNVAGERFRETGAWREWCHSQPEARPKAEVAG